MPATVIQAGSGTTVIMRSWVGDTLELDLPGTVKTIAIAAVGFTLPAVIRAVRTGKETIILESTAASTQPGTAPARTRSFTEKVFYELSPGDLKYALCIFGAVIFYMNKKST